LAEEWLAEEWLAECVGQAASLPGSL